MLHNARAVLRTTPAMRVGLRACRVQLDCIVLAAVLHFSVQLARSLSPLNQAVFNAVLVNTLLHRAAPAVRRVYLAPSLPLQVLLHVHSVRRASLLAATA